MSDKTVLITGGSGGLGSAAARYLAERGWKVFAADLEPIGLAPGITTFELDVTDPESIEAARELLLEEAGGLDGIVNFAGLLAVGSLIEMEEETLRPVLEVNVMGTIRVNRTLFPLVLAKKGRIVNISSETGWQSGMPFNGAYALSKHAIECYSDCLRRELMFLGVQVIKIQPGPFKTNMVSSINEKFTRAAERSTYFGEMLHRLKGEAIKENDKAHDPVLVAKAVHTALTAARPLPAYSVKPDLQRAAISILPAMVADGILKLALGRASDRGTNH
jgi:NAD(P)-dependent dehydrogenase (short-subunit alcohol dehydrogenase family)